MKNKMDSRGEEVETSVFVRWFSASSAAILLYLMISSSDTFGAFSPTPISHVYVYATSFIICAVIGWFSKTPSAGLVKVSIIVIMPPVLHAAAQVILQTRMIGGDAYFAYLLASWISPHVLVQILAIGFLGCAGLMLGIICGAYFGRI